MAYLRSAVAVLAGFLLTAALVIVTTFGAAVLLGLPMTGPPTPTYLVLNLLGGALAGVAGGYLCARTAPGSPAAHATALAVLMIVLSIPAIFAEPVPGRPTWYPLTLAVLGPASVMLGAWFFLRRSARTPWTAGASIIALLGVLTGCVAAGHAPPALGNWPQDEAEILAAAHRSAEAWNRGDLRGHLEIYVDSVTFMTADGPRPGVAAIEESFSRTYFSDGVPNQQLRFERVVVRPLGPDAALQTGRFVLSGGGRPDQSGWFTLVWVRTPDGWKAVHDHSS